MADDGNGSIARLTSGGDGLFRLSGELTVQSIRALWQQRGRLRAPGERITIDLSDVYRADSSGLALLVGWLREAKGSGTQLQFANIPDQLTSLARVSRVDGLLPVAAI